MSLEREVIEEIRQLTGNAIEAIIGAAEREQARLRAEACFEEVVAAEMLHRLPRIRWLARLIWRRKHRLRAANCAAQRRLHPEVDRICKAVAVIRVANALERTT